MFTETEVARIQRALWLIDLSTTGLRPGMRNKVRNQTRIIRLLLIKSARRAKRKAQEGSKG